MDRTYVSKQIFKVNGRQNNKFPIPESMNMINEIQKIYTNVLTISMGSLNHEFTKSPNPDVVHQPSTLQLRTKAKS